MSQSQLSAPVVRYVAVLMGGRSAEREVSLVSGEACAKALENKGYEVRRIDADCDLPTLIKFLTPKPDVVFNALHGQYGEDGRIQAVLDLLQIPYSHSGQACSSLAMDKRRSKKLLAGHGMPIVEDLGFSLEALGRLTYEPIPRPFVAKPVCEGSSVGIYIFTEGKNLSLGELATQEVARDWMLEPYIEGRELTVSVLDEKALAVTEIKPSTEFYDYEAKYVDGITQHLIPADIPQEVETEAKRLGVMAHEMLGCRGVSRSDFRLNTQNELFYLETNTQPGMTPLSLVPEQAQFVGMPFDDLVEWILKQATCDA